jgi:protein involved in polysaccharide export with SLBB domain
MAIQQAEIALQPRAQQQLPEPEPQPRTQAQPQPAFIDPFATPLRQYGYSLFSGNVSTFAPVDNVPVGPDYVVGPGDDLFINVWGPADSFLIRTVDRNGRIILPKVGDLQVWGLTFSQVERLIREQLSRYFLGYQTSVTMGRLRTVRVHVVGEVCQPGSFVLSSLSTLTNALFSAGGPTKLGSLRDVRLLRNGHTVGTLDPYDFLQRGDRTRDYRLESGDTIFVPTIGEVAAVTGEVKRPAIYEIRGDVRLADLIEMAGGVTPSSHLKRVQIVRSLPSAERVTIDVDLTDYYLKQNAESNPPVNGGDLVLIHRSDPRIYNTVKVDGAVKYPGVYELKPMMRVSQLLPSAKLLPEAFPDRVEITRRRPDLSIEIIQVNLKKAWSGDADQDPLLRPLDEIAVRTELRAVRTATLSGQVVRPGTYTIAEGEWLSSVLERAGGFTERAHLKGAIFTRASLRKVEQEQLDSFVKMQEQRILAAASKAVVGGETEEAALSAQTIQARLGLLRALAKRVAVGRMVVRLAPPEKLKNGSDDIVLIDGDSLEIPEPNSSVLVVGAVRNSTSVSYLQGANLEYYVNRVGGFSREADKKEVHLVKADGSALSGFANVRSVEPGDTIVVPPREETRVRVLPTIRDSLSILASTLTTVLSAAALALLF